MQQFHRIGKLYLHKVIEKCDRVYTAEKHQRVVASRQRNGKRNALVESCHAVQKHRHQLAECNAEQQSSADRNRRRKQHFQKKHPGDMFLLHPKYIVYAQFPLAPLHDEAVGIKQENRREQSDNDHSEQQRYRHIGAASHLLQPRVILNGHYQIEHRCREHPRQKVRQVKLSVIADIDCCQFDI